MKKIIFVLSILISSFVYGEEKAEITKKVSSVVSGAVSTGKNILKGVKEGIDIGRKEGTSVDGAMIIFDKESLEKYIEISIISVENLSDKNIGESENKIEYKITLGLKNNTDKPIRMTNLQERDSLQLLDKNGFAVFSSGPFEDVTIPKDVAIKHSFIFLTDGEPNIIKIYGKEFEVFNKILR
ncbi:hypothetical protein [Fusobacterium ulcerans]|jgi:hypothetical protein|uniref:hypothetical protein n=1 Tax=Fusobacterium ulcerans TaxID=861 RepID=UPI000E52ABCB|nr:hypothetical protein [Fusobacterium ulcerans]RGY58941.1 hypothetical protein DXA30_15870 [Fusobacterium ulcerans]